MAEQVKHAVVLVMAVTCHKEGTHMHLVDW